MNIYRNQYVISTGADPISGSRAHSGALALWAEKRPTPQEGDQEVCWAELPPRTTGGISPPQLRLAMLANCLRGPMSDRLCPAGRLRPPRALAAVGACEPIAPAEPGRMELSKPRHCVCPTLVMVFAIVVVKKRG
eukprot:COSAG06_NODE_1245_length_10117_cov_28.671990_18_plen_135_part_00